MESKDKHIAWGYEDLGDAKYSYYNIYPVSDSGNELLNDESLALTIPESQKASEEVCAIVAALERLVSVRAENDRRDKHMVSGMPDATIIWEGGNPPILKA